jgi:hypothetical protein
VSEEGTQNYRGLKLSFRRRAAGGVSLNGNYTLSRCYGLDWGDTSGTAGGFTNPADPSYDRGHCSTDRTHLANLTASVQTPEFASRALRALASNWRLGGILNARSGNWLTVTTGSSAFNGVGGGAGHRVDQVSDDVYGEKTPDSYLNRATFVGSGAGRVWRSRKEQHQRAPLLEGRRGGVAALLVGHRADLRGPRGGVQPLQHVQLGRSGNATQIR